MYRFDFCRRFWAIRAAVAVMFGAFAVAPSPAQDAGQRLMTAQLSDVSVEVHDTLYRYDRDRETGITHEVPVVADEGMKFAVVWCTVSLELPEGSEVRGSVNGRTGVKLHTPEGYRLTPIGSQQYPGYGQLQFSAESVSMQSGRRPETVSWVFELPTDRKGAFALELDGRLTQDRKVVGEVTASADVTVPASKTSREPPVVKVMGVSARDEPFRKGDGPDAEVIAEPAQGNVFWEVVTEWSPPQGVKGMVVNTPAATLAVQGQTMSPVGILRVRGEDRRFSRFMSSFIRTGDQRELIFVYEVPRDADQGVLRFAGREVAPVKRGE